MKKQLTAMERIQRALIGVMRDEPFYATILLKQELVEDRVFTGTFRTNGVTLCFNPDFVETLNDQAIEVILKHEADHIAFCHSIRLAEREKIEMGGRVGVMEMGDRDKMKFNIAADLAINEFLKDMPGFPEDAAVAGRTGFEDMPEGLNAEAYYHRLPSNPESSGSGEGSEGGEGESVGSRSGCDGDGGRSDEGGDDEEGDGQSDSSGDRGGDQEESNGRSQDQSQSDQRDSESDQGGDSGGASDSDSGEQESNGSGGAESGDNSGDSAGCSGQGTEDDSDQEAGSTGGRGKDQDQQSGGADVMGDKSFGTVDPHPAKTEEELEEARQDWETMVSQAIIAGKEAGKLPGEIEERITEMLGVSQVPWNLALRPFLQSVARTGYSYRRPNRRHGHRADVIMPSCMDRSLGQIKIACDCSGSMGQREMNLILPECEMIIKTFPDTEIEFIQFDTRITARKKIRMEHLPIDLSEWTWSGRGGTDFSEVIEECRRDGTRLLVVLTDGGVCSWPEKLSCPVLWLMTTDTVAPVGKTIRMEL